MKSQWIAGAFLIMALTVFATCGYVLHLRNQRDDAIASRTRVELEAEGFKEALRAKPKEILKLVPTIVTKEIERLVHEKKIAPVASGHIEAKTEIVFECPEGAREDGVVVPATPQTAKLIFTADLLITRIKFGLATEWKGGVGGSAQINGGPIVGLKFNDEDTKINIAFSDEIAKALYDHEREGGWLKRHTALVCPGVGVTYNPLDTGRPVNIGITCTYGLSWF